MQSIIIVEIPHQMPAKAWTAYGWGDAAERCVTRDGQTPGITTYSLADMLELFDGDESADAVKIAREHGKVVEVQRGHDQSEWVAPGTEPPLSEVVRDWISGDLNTARFLTSAEDVREFLATYTGHQAGKAKAAARREAEREGWIEAEDNEDA